MLRFRGKFTPIILRDLLFLFEYIFQFPPIMFRKHTFGVPNLRGTTMMQSH